MKYNKETVEIILQCLANGDGRVRAANTAGVSFDSFYRWMNTKPKFCEQVKKAEEIGYKKIHDVCERRVIEDQSWQSGAWWLERTDPANFGQRNNLNINAEKPLIVVADEETKKLLEKLDDNTSI